MKSLEYTFVFDKTATLWNHLYDFEKDLSDFFKAQGLEAELISPIEGNGGKGLMLIKKSHENEVLTNMKGPQLSFKEGKMMPSSNMVTNMTNRVNKVPGGKK